MKYSLIEWGCKIPELALGRTKEFTFRNAVKIEQWQNIASNSCLNSTAAPVRLNAAYAWVAGDKPQTKINISFSELKLSFDNIGEGKVVHQRRIDTT